MSENKFILKLLVVSHLFKVIYFKVTVSPVGTQICFNRKQTTLYEGIYTFSTLHDPSLIIIKYNIQKKNIYNERIITILLVSELCTIAL